MHWRYLRMFLISVVLLAALPVSAHVKWFSDFSFNDPPLSVSEALTPTFIGLTLLSVLVLGTLVFVDRRLNELRWWGKVNAWFEARRHNSLIIMRIATGITLMLSWQANTLLAPDLLVPEAWVGWLQFFIAGLLLFDSTTPLAGLGVLGLYGLGILNYGGFYMLDYAVFVGVGYFLMVSNFQNPRIKASRLPALYFTVGFSLCWLAIEKIIYPQWGIYILQQNPELTLGFPVEFFLLAAAFVEFSLGYLLIICLLQRPIALAVTLVFFTTTLVFGKVEVIGHTIIHGALLVFLLEGPGDIYQAPITFHKRLGMRVAFATVNFVLLLAIMMVPYASIAQVEYEATRQEMAAESESNEDNILPSSESTPESAG